jgi:hypothetical protein
VIIVLVNHFARRRGKGFLVWGGSASFFEKKEAKKLLSVLAAGAMAFGFGRPAGAIVHRVRLLWIAALRSR